MIIGTISNNTKLRFNELMNNLIGISPKSLATRLKDLEKSGIVNREIFAEIPPKVEYSLTKDGKEVRDAMKPLMEWAYKKSIQEKQETQLV